MKICGVDEVGCSAIAGPVFACAAVLDSSEQYINGVDDSKKLERQKREELVPLIEEKANFAFGAAGPREIEKLNIYWARYLAMTRAVNSLLRRNIKIDLILVDGNKTVPNIPSEIKQEAYPKADSKFWEVSCASILAKVKRDNLMTKLSTIDKYSYFGWHTNAGYYSPIHRKGIILYGSTYFHRKTFKLFRYCESFHQKHKLFLEKGGTSEEFFLMDEKQKKLKKERLSMNKCPICGEQCKEYNESFPFCSPRCKLIDLGNWLNEEYVISDNIPIQSDEEE